MQWFKHSADARNSLKLRKVRRKFGADGYAIYWFCLEAIAYEVDKDNLTFDLKEDAETIAFELSIQEKRVEEIMRYLVETGLFESSQGVITCLKLAERLDKSMTNSPKMRAWLDNKSVMTCADDVNTCAELDKTRLEEEKNKEITPLVQPKAKPRKYKFDSYQMDFAKWMFSLIQNLNPNCKEPNLESWANTIRLMIDADNRDGDHMVQVFTWANKDSFWCSNILSPSKLRDKYDDLVVKMNNGGNQSQPTQRTQAETDQFTAELNDQFERSQAAKARREARQKI